MYLVVNKINIHVFTLYLNKTFANLQKLCNKSYLKHYQHFKVTWMVEEPLHCREKQQEENGVS